MKPKQKTIFVFLILGLIFSSMFGITFNVSDGFIFQDYWIKIIPLPIFDYARSTPSQLFLTSTILGYLFFAVSGFLLIWHFGKHIKYIPLVIGFIGLTLITIFFEGSSFVQDLNSDFTGQCLRIGPTLFILGLLILLRNLKSLKTIK